MPPSYLSYAKETPGSPINRKSQYNRIPDLGAGNKATKLVQRLLERKPTVPLQALPNHFDLFAGCLLRNCRDCSGYPGQAGKR